MTTVRKLVYSIMMKADTGGAKQASDAADKAGASWENMSRKVAYAGAAIGGVLASLGYLVGNTAAFAEETQRSARGLAMTTTQFQSYKAGFDALGASTDDLMDAFGTLVDRSTDAMEGNKEYTKEFRRIGIAVDELKGKKAHEIFDLYIDRATKMKDRNQAITSAVRLFGDDLGRRLLPVMVESGESFKSLTKLVEDTGLALDDMAIKDLRTTAFEARRLTFIVKGLGRDLASELAPGFTNVAKTMGDILTERAPAMRAFFDEVGDEASKWAAKVSLALKDVDKAAGDQKGLGKLTDMLYRLGLVIGAGMVGVGIIAGVSALGVAFSGLTWPVIATFFAVSALVRHLEDLWVYMHGGLSLTGALGSKFEWLQVILDELKWAYNFLSEETTQLGYEFRELISLFTNEGPEGYSILEVALAALHVLLSLIISVVLALTAALVRIVRWFVQLAIVVTRVAKEIKYFGQMLVESFGEGMAALDRLTSRFTKFSSVLATVTGRGLGNMFDSSAVVSDPHRAGDKTESLARAGRQLVGGTAYDLGAGVGRSLSFINDDYLNTADQMVELGKQAGGPSPGMRVGMGGPGGARTVAQDVRMGNVTIQMPPGTDMTDPRAFGQSAADAFQSELLQSEDVLSSGVY